MFVWLSDDNYTEEATTSKPSESIKSNPAKKRKIWSKLKSGLYCLKLETGSVWQTTTSEQATKSRSTCDTTKICETSCKYFYIFNFKKWPVTASGGGGGVGGERVGREILRICTGNSDRNFIEENQDQNIRRLLYNTRILVETQSLQSWRKSGHLWSMDFKVDARVH